MQKVLLPVSVNRGSFHVNGFESVHTSTDMSPIKWKGRNTCGLLTKHEVKMAVYWPSPFFTCLWTETKSRSINKQKKLDRTSLVNKDLLYGIKHQNMINFPCRT